MGASIGSIYNIKGNATSQSGLTAQDKYRPLGGRAHRIWSFKLRLVFIFWGGRKQFFVLQQMLQTFILVCLPRLIQLISNIHCSLRSMKNSRFKFIWRQVRLILVMRQKIHPWQVYQNPLLLLPSVHISDRISRTSNKWISSQLNREHSPLGSFMAIPIHELTFLLSQIVVSQCTESCQLFYIQILGLIR